MSRSKRTATNTNRWNPRVYSRRSYPTNDLQRQGNAAIRAAVCCSVACLPPLEPITDPWAGPDWAAAKTLPVSVAQSSRLLSRTRSTIAARGSRVRSFLPMCGLVSNMTTHDPMVPFDSADFLSGSEALGVGHTPRSHGGARALHPILNEPTRLAAAASSGWSSDILRRLGHGDLHLSLSTLAGPGSVSPSRMRHYRWRSLQWKS
jgi:hypothetical protein